MDDSAEMVPTPAQTPPFSTFPGSALSLPLTRVVLLTPPQHRFFWLGIHPRGRQALFPDVELRTARVLVRLKSVSECVPWIWCRWSHVSSETPILLGPERYSLKRPDAPVG